MKKRALSNRTFKVSWLLPVFCVLILVAYAGIAIAFFKTTAKMQTDDDLDDNNLVVISNKADPLVESLSQELIAEAALHTIAEVSADSLLRCEAEDELHLMGDPMAENNPYELLEIFPDKKQKPKYHHICIRQHLHQHTAKLSIINGECNIYVTAQNRLPSPVSWDWRIDHRLSDTISIHTYSKEYQEAGTGGLVIAVVPENGSEVCRVSFEVQTFTNEELLHKLSLRGGKVLGKRDLDPSLLTPKKD
jgi:hypothetical protein